MDRKSVSRRVLLASAAALGSGMALPDSAHAADPGSVDADRVPTLRELDDLRTRTRKGVRPPKAATLRNLPNNPYFGPVGAPLDESEQRRNRPRAMRGPRL